MSTEKSTVEGLANPGLRHIAPYVPGKPIDEVKRELHLDEVIKLASNENPQGPPASAVEAIRKSLGEIHRYPEGSAFRLTKALAAHLNMPAEAIIMGSGSSEVISLFLSSFVLPGEEVIMPFPSFLVYRIICHMIGAVPVEVPLNADFTYDIDAFLGRLSPKTKMVILCNPNNPTGTILFREQLEKLLSRLPDHMLVLSDEAYAEYVESPDYGTAFPHIWERNVLVSRTFSKVYGLAGLRIGYGIARPDITGLMEKIRPPFNTTIPAQEGALAALQDKEYVRASHTLNSEGKKYLSHHLDELGIPFIPTEANFILCRFPHDASALVMDLERRGIIVRLVKPFGLPPNYVRITIGTHKENERLMRELKECYKKT